MDPEKLKNIRVLLVDDDEDDYILIKKVFSQIPESPFELEWTHSVSKAKQLIEKQKHDVYLIDYHLGEHTGLEVLEFAHPEKRSQPFILLTGVGNQAVEWRSMRLSASDYLVKGSFDANLLSRTLHYALQRKKAEELRMSHLLELNRSKDEFISIASHQLRTPATGVKQYIGILLEGFVGELTPAQKEILQKAYESNERQLSIVADLLKVARVDAGKVLLKKKNVKIHDLIEDVIHEQQNNFKMRNQEAQYIQSDDELSVYVDPASIRMVIENIVDNASKYSEDGTTITVNVVDDGDKVRISISDQGVGIDAADEERLYEKFSRLDNPLSTKVGGTGLGLYWSKRIVDLHEGTLTHKANDDKGTTFTICLPKHK